MKNPLLEYEKDQINNFTIFIKSECLSKGYCRCKLVNNTIIDVYLLYSEDDDAKLVGFKDENYNYVWKLNGRNLTSFNFHIAEILDLVR